jgi:hypothetical protein
MSSSLFTTDDVLPGTLPLENYMAEFHGFIARVYTVLPRQA